MRQNVSTYLQLVVELMLKNMMVLIKYYIQQLKKVNLTHVNWLIQGNKILDLIKYCASHL